MLWAIALATDFDVKVTHMLDKRTVHLLTLVVVASGQKIICGKWEFRL